MQSVKNDMTKKNLDEETDGVVAMSRLARHLIYGDIEVFSMGANELPTFCEELSKLVTES